MKWIKATISTTTIGAEALSANLLDFGIEGTEVVDTVEMKQFLKDNPLNWDYVDDEIMQAADSEVQIKFYVADDEDGHKILDNVKNFLDELKAIANKGEAVVDFGELCMTHTTNLDDTAWLTKWKENYKPFRVGKNIIIKPTWEEFSGAETDIIFNIEPGHVFGTGLHQTTRLVISAVEELEPTGTVLDIGCGSGVLSIISMLCGAKTATAIDIDPTDANIAQENAKLNGIFEDRYKACSGNLLDSDDMTSNEDVKEILLTKYDLILANIVADVVIALTDIVPNMLNENGTFICSGIIDSRIDDVVRELRAKNFEIYSIKNEDSWYSVRAFKK